MQEEQQVKVEVAYMLNPEQFAEIQIQAYKATLEGIEQARADSSIDSDLLFSKAACRRYLNNMSADYFEELLAMGLPQGRMLSDRKICFSKKAVKTWLLENENK